jgi:ABC-type multidrug transport system fused ATPase/permease subunit
VFIYGILKSPLMKNIIRIAPFLKPYVWQIAVTLFTLLTLTGMNLLVPRIIQNVIDDGLMRGDTTYLVRSALLLLGLGLGSALLSLVNRYSAEWVATHVGFDLRNRMYDHIQYLPFEYHDHAQSGQLISRCIEDVRAIERFSGSSIAELVRFVLLTVGILFVMLSSNVTLALIALAADDSLDSDDGQFRHAHRQTLLRSGCGGGGSLQPFAGECDGCAGCPCVCA